MAKISLKFRKQLAELAETLIDSGINVLPKRYDSKSPAFRKGEKYQKYLVSRIDEDFKKFIIKRILEDETVGGLSVIMFVGGLIGIDYDVLKVDREMEKAFKKLTKEYYDIVYMERRYGVNLRTQKLLKHGAHILLFANTKELQGKRIVVHHNFNAEFTVKRVGLLTIYPSVLVDKKEKEFSMYLKLSGIDLQNTYYDKDLDVLNDIISKLGGKLELIDVDTRRVGSIPTSDGEPVLGLKYDEINGDNVVEFLKLLGELSGCEGLKNIVEMLEDGQIVPYFIYSDYVYDTNHPRSSWTIIENHVFRLLAELGAHETAFDKMYELFKKAEDEYEKVYGKTAHKTLYINMKSAQKFKEFGHDKGGACIYQLLGLCNKQCTLNLYTYITTEAFRQAIITALKVIKSARRNDTQK